MKTISQSKKTPCCLSTWSLVPPSVTYSQSKSVRVAANYMANRMASWANPETAPPMGGFNER